MHTISQKAIRFWHPDYDPDRAEKLISSSMFRHLSTRKMSSKSMHAFLSTRNLANRQTDKHRGQSHLPHPLSEVNKRTCAPAADSLIANFNPLIATLKPQSHGPSYSNTVIGTLAVDGWAVTFGTARRGLGGGQCTNFVLFDVAL